MFEIIPIENTDSYRFILKTKNGEVLLVSISFDSLEETEKAIASCKTLSPYKTRFERKTAPNGKFLFILKDTTGKMLAESRYYTSEAGMQNGMEAVRKYSTDSIS